MISRTLIAGLMAIALAACGGGGEPGDVLPRQRFVEANVALRLLPENATEADRRAVLKKFRVTDKQMLAWLDAHRNDPAALAETWEAVAKRVDSVSALRPRAPDSAANNPAGQPPVVPGASQTVVPAAPGQPVPMPPPPGQPPVVTQPAPGPPVVTTVRPGPGSPFDSLAARKRRSPDAAPSQTVGPIVPPVAPVTPPVPAPRPRP